VVVCPCPVSPVLLSFRRPLLPAGHYIWEWLALLNGEVFAPVFCAAAVGFGGYWVRVWLGWAGPWLGWTCGVGFIVIFGLQIWASFCVYLFVSA